jgi:Ceramidase
VAAPFEVGHAVDWSQPIDLYCERTDPTFWSEPANAVSNVAFLVAAAAAFIRWWRGDRADWPALALIGVVTAVGIGSLTFHTVATRGAVLADVIPIAVFIYGYLFLALRRFLRLPCIAAGAIVVAYAAAAQGISALAPPRFLNGSVGYLPALAALIAVAAVAKEEEVRRGLALAALLFAISLALRAADIALCPAFPLGTHFAWHILKAVVLYVLLRTAMSARPSGVAQ